MADNAPQPYTAIRIRIFDYCTLLLDSIAVEGSVATILEIS